MQSVSFIAVSLLHSLVVDGYIGGEFYVFLLEMILSEGLYFEVFLI